MVICDVKLKKKRKYALFLLVLQVSSAVLILNKDFGLTTIIIWKSCILSLILSLILIDLTLCLCMFSIF